MKIRFKTKDNVSEIKECPHIEEPVSVVMSPMWQEPPRNGFKPPNFMKWRRYEFNGIIEQGIPTVHETCSDV